MLRSLQTKIFYYGQYNQHQQSHYPLKFLCFVCCLWIVSFCYPNKQKNYSETIGADCNILSFFYFKLRARFRFCNKSFRTTKYKGGKVVRRKCDVNVWKVKEKRRQGCLKFKNSAAVQSANSTKR